MEINDRQAKPIHIAVVLPTLNAGGAELRMLDIIQFADRSKYRFDLIILLKDDDQFYEKDAATLGIKIIKMDSPRTVGVLSHYKQLKKTFNETKYDAVHSNTSYHSGLVLMAAKHCGIPVRISHARTNDLRHKTLKGKLSLILGRYLISRYATSRLAISRSSAVFLYGENNDALIIPNAIQTHRYALPDPSSIQAYKAEYDLENKTVIGHVGRFDEAKNQEFLIRVFAKYRQIDSDSILVLIGDGKLRQRCKELTKELCILDHVLFLGVRHDVDIWMNLFSVFVFPSKYEGLGNVAVEAQASGLACLCSDSVPHSINMGLGLVEYLSLDDCSESWCEKIHEMSSLKRLDKNIVLKAFDDRKYTLTEAVKTLCEIYEGNNG